MQTQREQALAKSRLYHLLQQLYLDGVTSQSLPVVRALADLTVHLPSTTAADTDNSTALVDQMAATHQELFGFNLFPYESIFLEQEGLLGSALSEEVATAYRAVGYTPSPTAGAPDHIGEEVGILAHLCAAEADAWEDGREEIAQHMMHEQLRFLETHLLRWLTPCMTAIQRHDDPFFAQLSQITTELVADHYAGLSTQVAIEQKNSFATSDIPSSELLRDPQTSLKDIAHFLTTPINSGIFFSRYLVNRMGRNHRLPRGFGSREQMLTNLLRTAAQYDALPDLLTSMKLELQEWQQAYQLVLDGHPAVADFVQQWIDRVQMTQRLLVEIDVALVANES